MLEQLKYNIKCKSIWVEDAYKYRNPDEDLPKDFDKNISNMKLKGTPLQVKVWKYLMKIPKGKTKTYLVDAQFFCQHVC